VEGCPPLRQFAWTDFDIMQKVGEGTTGYAPLPSLLENHLQKNHP
jgi:hypothetical protein